MEGMITMQGFMKMEYRSAWITFPITWDICLPEEQTGEQEMHFTLASAIIKVQKTYTGENMYHICLGIRE